MLCLFPRTVGFKADGKTLCWSRKDMNPAYPSFELPCGKCLECRLSYAREWAVRCVHEAQMHEKNCFITLTYDDDNIGDGKLDYTDFQNFMKKLRKVQNDPIGVFVTGEYGEKTKRKHWHALLFNWQPGDLKLRRTTERGDRAYSSEHLDRLWGRGRTEIGDVTFESAGYCARYAAKKLVHGKDSEHDYQPISKKSSKNAIGKAWIEKYWRDVFNHGYVVLKSGSKCGIPRYYEKWFKKNLPNDYFNYVTKVKPQRMEMAADSKKKVIEEYLSQLHSRDVKKSNPLTPNQVRKKIITEKFKKLQDYLKL